MAATQINRDALLRAFVNDIYELDAALPHWGRRRHPIVKRHLGLYWRIMPPQAEPIVRWFLMGSALVLLTIPIPFLFTILLPLVLVSMAVLPGMLVYYGRMLYDLATDTSRQMVGEIENHTLGLLLATPVPRREVLLAKMAGSLWKQSEPFGLLMAFASMTQVPSMFLLYANLYPPAQYDSAAQLLTVGAFAGSLLRVPIEMFMTAALGLYIGTVTRGKGAAAASTIGIVGFYFLLVNVIRVIPMQPFARFVVEAVVPCVTALLTSLFLILMTERELFTD
ncbi:MAG: ABC transporter permease subunit [Chloroflexi bacterium]|nr:ABC transporter permease subunit [Chloroflexota bacterium]